MVYYLHRDVPKSYEMSEYNDNLDIQKQKTKTNKQPPKEYKQHKHT